MFLFLLVFVISALFTLFLTPVAKRLALVLGAVDKPSKRKIHKKAVPRFGGLPIFISFVAAIAVGLYFSRKFGINLSGKEINAMVGIIYGALAITILGLIDDIQELPAPVKLLGQIAAACIAIFFGTKILFISTPFAKLIILGAWVVPVTILWMVAMSNAMNLIDGLDGLASGITVIAGSALFAVAIKMGQMDSAFILCALVGAAIGFLRYNFFPASIFLGDSGSLFFGFMLAAASIVGVLKSTLVIALIIPVAVLAVPIFDTASVIIRRAIAGKPIFEADKRHLHHRLLKAGFNQREVVIIIYVACVILSLAALAASAFDNYQALIVLTIIVVLGVVALDFAKELLKNIAFLGNGLDKK
jgi:UDP-GlcNAc:undecaprenyl-phosphate/decaprenyl-phosphate GlcNAc-1-phosphate transferase